MGRPTKFKTEARYRLSDLPAAERDLIVEVTLWYGDGGGSWQSLGQPIKMSESQYIAFIHAFRVQHEWRD